MVKQNKNQERQNIITIDGPSGSGKGTVALLVASRLGFAYLDSGALYRAIAYFFLQKKISPQQVSSEILHSIPQIQEIVEGETLKIYLGSSDITEQIRLPECTKVATELAALEIIRAVLLDKQREFYDESKGLVCDGRDMGKMVFPEARLKIFLTASSSIRANRRLGQLKSMKIEDKFENVLAKLEERDYNDENRLFSPLVCPSEAITIDSSNMRIDEVVDKIVDLFGKSQF